MLPVHNTKLSVYNYDEIPPGYYYNVMKTGRASQRFWHEKKFAAVADAVQGAQRVLDLGCGPGSFLAVLASQNLGIEGTGVDIASGQIDFAKEQIAAQFPTGRLTFDALEPGPNVALPYDDESFDAVTCIEVVEHIHPNLAMRLLLEGQRVLKPGGRMVVTTPNYRSAWPAIELLLEKLSPVKYHDQHINKLTPNSLVKTVESVGMSIKSVRTIFLLAPFVAELSWGTC